MEPSERSAGDALLEHRGFVRALAKSLVDGEAGEDVAQDALVAGLSQPPRQERAWRAWLRSTVRHLASNLLRSRRRVDARERAAARPEALPSTASLVVRLELEQRVVAAVLTLPEAERAVVLLHFYDGQENAAIAAKLRVPPDTVRARLRRALARLRAVLDRDCGDRGAWVRGLAPLLGWRSVPVGATPLAAGGLEVGAAVMGVKGVATLLAGAAALVAACWLLPDSSGGSRRSTISATSGASDAAAGAVEQAPGAPEPALATRDLAAAAERRSVAGEELEGNDADDFEMPGLLPPPGEVAFRVVDARTRAALDAVTIRFQSDHRFAQYDGGGDGRARLTAGAWTGRVVAPGREPLDLGGFEIAVGETCELGTLELVGGGGRIEGRVVARHVLDRSVRVELFGDGRAPCDDCRQEEKSPTPCCGFGPGVSSFTLADGDRFSFRNLAAGIYWLRAFDAEAQLADVRRVELARNGALWIDLDVTRSTSLAFELRHADGHRFTGVWSHPHRAVPAPIRFEVVIADRARGVASALPAAEEVCATMGPPIPTDPPPREEDPLAATLDGVEPELARLVATESELRQLLDEAHSKMMLELPFGSAPVGNDRLDRVRTEQDSLAGLLTPPELPEVALAVVQERPDRFVVAPLPRELVTVRVSSGAYVSDELDVYLRDGFTGPLVVVLACVDDGSACAGGFAGVTESCATCHRGGAQERADLLTSVLRAQLDEIEARAATERAALGGR